jgi:hypothetical protein
MTRVAGADDDRLRRGALPFEENAEPIRSRHHDHFIASRRAFDLCPVHRGGVVRNHVDGLAERTAAPG